MKWVAFVALLVIGVVLGILARSNEKLRGWLVLLLPMALLSGIDVSPIWIFGLRADALGVSLSISDVTVMALLISLPQARWPAPFRVVRYLYYAICFFSIFQAFRFELWFFGMAKMSLAYMYLNATARIAQVDDLKDRLIKGLALAFMMELYVQLTQRYLHHVYQVPGTFAHQNSLGMALNLSMPIVFSYFLSRLGKERQWLLGAGLAAGMLSVILTLSRGSMGLVFVGAALTYFSSLGRRIPWQKVAFAFLAFVAAAALFIRSGDTIMHRFESGRSTSEDGRDLYEDAARFMHDAHPAGVGLNHFSENMPQFAPMAGITGYDATVIVHNVYLLTAAELGYLGLGLYLLTLLHPFVVGVFTGARRGDNPNREVALACSIGILCFAVQGNLEWAARQTILFDLFWMVAGLVGTLHRVTAEQQSPQGA